MANKEDKRLAKELDFYALHKHEWLMGHRGYYVVVKDTTVLGFFRTFETAYRTGAETWGVGTDFLVRQVLDHVEVISVFQSATHLADDPCQT